MAKKLTIGPRMAQLEGLAEEKLKSTAKDIVEYAVDLSPVDTGAYVESFSVVPRGSSNGRSRSSKGKPRNQDEIAVKQAEKARLFSEVDTLNIYENKGFTINNRSPHADLVETGESWPVSDGRFVFKYTRTYAKDRFR